MPATSGPPPRYRLLWRVLVYCAILVCVLAFPYGPFLPWSPFAPGYTRYRLNRADVLFRKGAGLPAVYRDIDHIIAEAEKFHRIPLGKRITVIACRDWGDFGRFMPTVRSHGVAAVTLMTGTVIYVTPKTTEKNLDTVEFLRHEISHAVLHQNQSMLHAFVAQRQQWLLEGLAVSFGRQIAYATTEEFLASARSVDQRTVIDPEQYDGAASNIRFSYQAWRFFLEYLTETRGRNDMQRFLEAYIASPSEYRSRFVQVFGMTFPEAIDHFQNDIRQNNWRPDPGFVAKQLRLQG